MRGVFRRACSKTCFRAPNMPTIVIRIQHAQERTSRPGRAKNRNPCSFMWANFIPNFAQSPNTHRPGGYFECWANPGVSPSTSKIAPRTPNWFEIALGGFNMFGGLIEKLAETGWPEHTCRTPMFPEITIRIPNIPGRAPRIST